MKAVIHWHDMEPHSHCECEKRSQGSTRQLSGGMTPYMLKFERRWYRIYKSRFGGSPEFFIKYNGEKYQITFQGVPATVG